MATVNLSFKPVDAVVREDRGSGLETYDPGIVEETILLMPVQLVIDSVEILALQVDPVGEGYVELPLVGFCAALNDAVDKIQPGVEVDGYMAGGGWLRFLETSDQVRVRCTLNDRVAYATRRELVAAARKFRDDVRDWLQKNVPELQSHPHWKKWFPDPGGVSP